MRVAEAPFPKYIENVYFEVSNVNEGGMGVGERGASRDAHAHHLSAHIH